MISCMRAAPCRKARSDSSPSAARRKHCSKPSLPSPAAGATSIPRWRRRLALAEFDGATKSPVEQLSEREFEVFVRLAGGATVQRIAQDLKLSASTVGTHLYNIKQKLGVVNQSELTLIAIRHGLIEA